MAPFTRGAEVGSFAHCLPIGQHWPQPNPTSVFAGAKEAYISSENQ